MKIKQEIKERILKEIEKEALDDLKEDWMNYDTIADSIIECLIEEGFNPKHGEVKIIHEVVREQLDDLFNDIEKKILLFHEKENSYEHNCPMCRHRFKDSIPDEASGVD